LERVHQLCLLPALFSQLLCKGFLSLGHHVLAGLGGGFLDVLRTAGPGKVFGHLTGHGPVLAHKVCRAAELMLVGHPQKVEEQQVGLALGQTCAASHHLAVQAAHFGGPQHHHTVHAGAVPALGEQHGIAEHVVLPGIEVGQHFLAVGALAVDLGGLESLGVEQIPELLAGFDEGQEHHRLAVPAPLYHLGGDLFQIRVQRRAQFPYGVVAAAEGHAGDVQFQGNGLGHDLAQITLFDGIGQLVLIGQAVEHLAQVPHVAAVWGGGHAQHLCTLEVVQDAAVAVGDGVVGLVDDDGAEVVPGKAFQPSGALQGLHAAHHHPEPAVQAGGLCLFHGADKAGGTLELVSCLFQQLSPVGQDEHPVPGTHLISGNGGEYDGLAGSGGQHQQRAQTALFPLGVDAVPGGLLIGAQGLDVRHQNAPCVQP